MFQYCAFSMYFQYNAAAYSIAYTYRHVVSVNTIQPQVGHGNFKQFLYLDLCMMQDL